MSRPRPPTEADIALRKRVGRNLKRLREERGWTAEALAWRAETPKSYVSKIERGVRAPSLTMLRVLADTLEVEPWVLLMPDAEGGIRDGEAPEPPAERPASESTNPD